MSARTTGLSAVRLGLAVVVLATGSTRAAAQGWIAQLVLAPMPSPFLSDWEADPSIGELIVTNTTGSASDVTFHYSLTRGGQQVLRGVTDPHPVPAQESVVFNAMSTFGGRADWDRSMQDLVARTGRLPEGDYEGCVTLVGPGGLVLVERECARFTLEYPDPPFLVFPMNGDTLTSQDPIFEWQPVQLSPLADARVGYVLQVAEVRTDAGQIPEVALQSNILHYYEPDLIQSSHQYPIGGMPFVPGRTYAWRVVALGGDGRPIASNQGQSEIWTFVFRDPQQEVEGVVASIALTARRDTLRFAGDTARFEAKAYDADGIELIGKRLDWASLDTSVVRVDATGFVTGIGAGETRVVASADGVADSAVSVTAAAAMFTVGFEQYDAEVDAPSLLALINSGSFEEIAPKLSELLRSGEFRIPIPRLPGLGGAPGGADDAGVDAGAATSGPTMRRSTPPRPPNAERSCGSALAVDPLEARDEAKKVWTLSFVASYEVMQCLSGREAPAEQDVTQTTTARIGAILVVSWLHPGMPRAFLAVKGTADLALDLMTANESFAIDAVQPLAGFGVLNVSRAVTVGSEMLPGAQAEFFGAHSFDAGFGLTAYAKFRCVNDANWPCSAFMTINPEDPELTVLGFLGVTASETSVGSGGVGTSLALGFSISATLPVKRLDFDIGELSIDSVQVGLLFAAQDSMVLGGGATGHNLSIGIAPTLTTWISGSAGNTWQVDGSLGLEWDPGADQALRPKLVFAASLPQVWQLWWFRLGNPQLVFTTPIGPRRERQATEVALSGTWGVGENNGVGVVEEGGGDVRGDVGGGASGGATGFEETGRAQLTFKWQRPPTAESRTPLRAARDSSIAAYNRQVKAVADARAKVEQARRDREWALNTTEDEYAAADSAFNAANTEQAKAIAQLEQLHRAREAAHTALGTTPTCWKTVKDRCLNWSLRASVGNGSLMDIVALLGRMVAQ